MLQLRHITKIYKSGNNEVTALDNINIDFPDKGLVFVVGKSGSGKSTLLNILGGLDKMNQGEIIINGRSTKDFSSSDFDAYRNYHIGFIFQEFNLIEDLSVKENIALALKIQSKGHDETTIDEALKLVNLEGLGYRSPKELSGGQKQRIAVARALVKNPNIILADEPTGALDSKTGYDLMSSLKSLSVDKLVIVVTHDSEMANIFGDEIIQLNDGHILNHFVISPHYIKPSNEIISNEIIKISSGSQIQSKDIINQLLKKDVINYVCLTSQPELLTIAYPETYDKIFKKEDLSSKFVTHNDILQNVATPNENQKNQKAKIKTQECFKMAWDQFKRNKGRYLFLIIFTIIAFSLLGFSSLFFTVNDSDIIANTLNKNQLNLGIMEKYSGNQKVLFDNDFVDDLNQTEKDTSYYLSKKLDLNYTSSSQQTNSPFEMKYFRGIIECNDIHDLNLKILEGKASFDEHSLENHEIILSDYAAFELRRTGYLGYDKDGNYGVIRPNTLQEQLNTFVVIDSTAYQIVGVFQTNYEDFLPLLVSEIYVDEEETQISSLNALKTYYYARIFAPKGFYENYLKDNPEEYKPLYSITMSKIPLYKYDAENEQIIDSFTYEDLNASNISEFICFDDIKSDLTGHYETIWGNVPESLDENQVILSYDWIRTYGFTEYAIIDKAMEAFNQNVEIFKMLNTSTTDYPIYNEKIEVVAVIDIDDNYTNSGSIFAQYYNEIEMFFSKKLADQLNSTFYKFDQIVFTLNHSVNQNAKTIKNLFNDGFRVLNIDGSVPTDSLDIESFQMIALIASCVIFLFAVLFMFNHVSSSIKKRKKEIGILRATGARGRDIVKIFTIEEGILSFIVAFISLLIIFYATSLANSNLGNIAIGIRIININVLHLLIFILFTMLFFIVTTIIPVISIAKMKPIDAIRKI